MMDINPKFFSCVTIFLFFQIFSPFGFTFTDDELVTQLSGLNKIVNPMDKLVAMEVLLQKSKGFHIVYLASEVSMLAFKLEEFEKAATHSNFVIENSNNYIDHVLTESLLHSSYTILGIIAFKVNDFTKAKEYLLLSAKPLILNPQRTSGPIRSFGPNMKLAEYFLLEKESEIVIKYLKLCKGFWKVGIDKLNDWIMEIDKGKIPAFGKNLKYNL